MGDRTELLRQGFRYGNKAMVLGWRLGAGSFMNLAWLSGQIMVITHTGRSSGRTYRTPVNYALWGEDLYCIAGFGAQSDWYRNVLACPEVEIWLPSRTFGGPVAWWRSQMEPADDCDDHLDRLRDVLVASGFAGRLDGFRPSMSDAELQAAAHDYPLMRVRLVQPCTGDGGPGDLSAIWLGAVTIAAPLVAARLVTASGGRSQGDRRGGRD